jgi:hypothetical protein
VGGAGTEAFQKMVATLEHAQVELRLHTTAPRRS